MLSRAALGAAARAAGGAAVIVAAVAAGCGGDGGDRLGEAADGVATVVAERLGVEAAEVAATCATAGGGGDGALEAGDRLACSVVAGGADAVQVELEVVGDGTAELRQALIPTEEAEAYLAGELGEVAGAPLTPDCGDGPLLVAGVGEELRCVVVRDADRTVHTVVVEVLDLDGTVRYRVEAAGSVPAPASAP